MSRDRFATRALILESAASIIASAGVSALGINSLAEAAKCDKVLIYRYFGGLDGVLAALSAERMLWPRVKLAEGGDESLADAVQSLLLEEWAALSGSTLMLASATAELSNRGAPLGAATFEQRTELHAKMVASLRDAHHVPPYVDLPAFVELLSAALTVFAMRAAHSTSKSTPAFDPASPQGWRRIEKILSAITRALLDSGGR